MSTPQQQKKGGSDFWAAIGGLGLLAYLAARFLVIRVPRTTAWTLAWIMLASPWNGHGEWLVAAIWIGGLIAVLWALSLCQPLAWLARVLPWADGGGKRSTTYLGADLLGDDLDWAKRIVKRWPDIAETCGMARKSTDKNGNPITVPPVLVAVEHDPLGLLLTVHPLPGQKRADLLNAAGSLETAVEVTEVRAKVEGTDVRYQLVIRDPLAGTREAEAVSWA